jgi:splicing factor U2AF subunit
MYQRRRESLWDRMEAPDSIEVELAAPSGMNPVLKRQQRRLYFGNIPGHVNEQELMDFVNNTMISSGTVTQKGNPVQSVVINREKAYAFVEFRSDEESSIGMGLDGITIQGQILRVRRPKDFNEGSEMSKPVVHASVVSSNAGESPHKIYMGNIPTSLGEGDVKKLLSMFGQLRSFNLVRDALTGLSKGFAFCEFSDITVTDAACKALHQMVIGDKTLVCQRASIQLASRVAEENTVLVDPRAAAMLTLSAPTASLLAAAIKDEEVKPTRILVLLNILDITDFPGDKVHEEYDELYSDMIDFFAQFGKVNKVLIPRPLKKIIHDSIEHFDFKTYIEDEEDDNNSDDEEAMKLPGFGKVFVEFQEEKDSHKAMEAMTGLRYNGRMVITSFLSEEKWEAGLLEPDNLTEISMVRMLKPDMSKYA